MQQDIFLNFILLAYFYSVQIYVHGAPNPYESLPHVIPFLLPKWIIMCIPKLYFVYHFLIQLDFDICFMD